MITINVIDKTGELLETHQCNDGRTIKSWLFENVESYECEETAPFLVELNGKNVSHDEVLKKGDVVRIKTNPQDAFAVVYTIVAVASAVYAYSVAKSIDNLDQNYENTSESGRSIYSPSVNNNSAKLNGYIRDIAGRMNVYPDLINRARRRFEDKQEFVYFAASVGEGYYFTPEDSVFISESKQVLFTQDVDVDIFEPAEDISSDVRFQNWITSKEVNSLTLRTGTGERLGNWAFDFSGASMTSRLDGSTIEFPFAIGELFLLQNTVNEGAYRVLSKSGASDSVATVEEVQLANGDRNLSGYNAFTTISLSGADSEAAIAQANYYNPVGNVYIDDTPITPSFPAASNVPVDILGIRGGLNWEGDFRILPSGETSRFSEFDVFMPRGLIQLDSEGRDVDATVILYAEWRDENDETWTRVDVNDTTFTDKTRDQIGFTVEVDHGSDISPVWRFARLTIESSQNEIIDLIEIRSLRSKLDAPSSYEDITTIGVKLRGTNAVARTAQDKVNLRNIERKLPTLAEFQSGSWDLSKASTAIDVNYNIENAQYVQDGDLFTIPNFTNGFIHGEFDSTSEFVYFAADKLIVSYKLQDAGEISEGTSKLELIGEIDASSTINAGDISLRNGNRDLYEIYNGNIKQHRFLGDNNLNTAFTVAVWPIDFPAPPTGTRAFDINLNADRFWVYDANNNLIKSYSIATANEIGSGVTNLNINFDLTPFLGGLFINSLRFQNYVAGQPTMFFVAVGLDVLKFEMSTPGNVSTASLVTSETLGRQADGIAFPNNRTDILYTFNSRFEGSDRLFYTDKYALTNYAGDSRATRSAARFIANQIYTSVHESNPNWSDLIDWQSLQDLDNAMSLAGQTFDAEFVDETTLWEAIKIAMSSGNAEPTIKNGKLSAVIDNSKSGEDFQHLYTPEVMTDGLEISAPFYDNNENDCVEAEFFDLITGTNETVKFPSVGVNPRRLQAIGIRDSSNVDKFAARAYQKDRLKPQIFRFTTELDALNSEYGDYIGIASSLFAAQTGDVIDYDPATNTVTLSFAPRFEYVSASETTPLVMLRTPEGRYSGVYGAFQTAEDNKLQLSGILDFTPLTDDDTEDNTQIVFGFGGVGQSFVKGALVREINPAGDTQVEVVAEEYIEEIYEND